MSGDNKVIALFGASAGVGLSALKHTLAAGHQCIALCRTVSKLTALFPTETTPNLQIVEGNAHDIHAVSKCIQRADGKLVDFIVSTIGAKPVMSKTMMDDPQVCGKAADILLQALAHLRSQGATGSPHIIVGSTTGLSRFGRDVPLAMLPLYHVALKAPHADKIVMEDRVAESQEIYTIVRMSLLTNGESTKDIRVGIEDHKDGRDGKAVLGYTISREDAGKWVAENLVLKTNTKYSSKIATITY